MTQPDDPQPDLPPENGERARVDADGSVHGSGVGAGGGETGEDYGDDRATGSGYPLTGVEDDDQPD